MDKKMICGVLMTIVGLAFSAFCFLNAIFNSRMSNSMAGAVVSLLGLNTMDSFLASLAVMILGLVICFWSAFGKRK